MNNKKTLRLKTESKLFYAFLAIIIHDPPYFIVVILTIKEYQRWILTFGMPFSEIARVDS